MQYISKFIYQIKEFTKAYKLPVSIALLGAVLIFSLLFLASSPSCVKKDKNINISNGLSLMQISLLLKESGVVRSDDVFRVIVILLGGEKNIKAGPYLFDGTENVLEITRKLISADYGVPVKKITIIEGMRGRDMLNLFGEDFTNLDKTALEKELLAREGYLFPDTYFIPLSASARDIIKMLSDNFDKHILTIDLNRSVTSKVLNEVITMASIIEGEAVKDEDRRIIADILWRRIEIGMPLQVDTTFMYINGKASSELTKADLKIDSPYNTYVNKGLPPGPISNPGLEAINSVISPTPNKYLYYLSDTDGVMHYANTFVEHIKNKEKYLK
jgi:UPF0755 protein